MLKKCFMGILVGCTVSGNPVTGKVFTETAFGINMKMIYVEGGDFIMGATSEQGDKVEDCEKPVRRVTLDSYYIGVFEVTQGQWEKVMGGSVTQLNKPLYGVGSDYPMYYVTWDEAQAFCRELSRATGRIYTLPTEAQWEYAARGGKRNEKTKFSGSNWEDAIAWYNGNSGGVTHPVGMKRPNALGLYDMSGNVWEWCEDRFGDYRTSDTHNPTGSASGIDRVLRGGSFYGPAEYCRVAIRLHSDPDVYTATFGFRVAMIPS